MKKCEVCRGDFHGEECPFAGEEYITMKQGPAHEQQLGLARWVLHAPGEHAEGLLEWARRKVFQEK